MQRRSFLTLATALAATLVTALPSHAEDTLVVIANAPLRGVDAEAIKRIYTGRLIEIDGLALRPVNAAPGSALRRSFLAAIVKQSDEDYLAYWTVRRYIGKGVPPRDLASSAEVIAYVQQTPGALGYIEASEVRSGMNVVLRR